MLGFQRRETKEIVDVAYIMKKKIDHSKTWCNNPCDKIFCEIL